jgi:hypothetical protein
MKLLNQIHSFSFGLEGASNGKIAAATRLETTPQISSQNEKSDSRNSKTRNVREFMRGHFFSLYLYSLEILYIIYK